MSKKHLLYKKNGASELSDKLFAAPTAEYRGTPFWSWNNVLEDERCERQIDYLREMGMGGFHMHARTGLASDYLGPEFMHHIKQGVKNAEKRKMLAWLYDEDRWPSGSAGGIVTKDKSLRQRILILTRTPRPDSITDVKAALANAGTYLLAAYDVTLSDDGTIAEYRRIGEGDKAKGVKLYAYSHCPGPRSWFNGEAYVDTLSKRALDRFIEVTYEAYKREVGDKFGKSIPAIFTDEPEFWRKAELGFAHDDRDAQFPWSGDLAETYKAAYGSDLLDFLPELVWELPSGAVSKARYNYHDHVSQRYTEAFADNCGAWCAANNIYLTGHLMEEDTLKSQTGMIGEAMRPYRGFGIPGIDLLADQILFNTAKQTQSAVHQYGKEGMLSELYGVTGWHFKFADHKFQGDWQAALGVSVRVLHLSWYSMEGEAKRDYPASIFYQSPWYREYEKIESHYARINTALTRGKPIVKVGVIHPIESYWLRFGPYENTGEIRRQKDENHKNLTDWLLLNGIDFDFICESLLPEQCKKGNYPLRVGQMAYDAIIVPACETLRSTTLERLKLFKRRGGKLIFMGECPKFLDAAPSDEIAPLYNRSITTSFEREPILRALEDERLIDIRNLNGRRADRYIYNLRKDGGAKWLFVCRGIKEGNPAVSGGDRTIVKIKGEYEVTLYDTLTGEVRGIAYSHKLGWTEIPYTFYCTDSVLLKLLPKNSTVPKIQKDTEVRHAASYTTHKKVAYKREEPNVLVLDVGYCALDGGEFTENPEELLRFDQSCRAKLGWSPRGGDSKQPWALRRDGEDRTDEHHITMRFTVNSEISYKKPILGIERAASSVIIWNGERVEPKIKGYYVDEFINTVPLPPLKKGENTLEVTIELGRFVGAEALYLLGDFDVRLAGQFAVVTEKTKEIAFGDIVGQGMPFYGGNLRYSYDIEIKQGGEATLVVPHYENPLLHVYFDGRDAGTIMTSPHSIKLGAVEAGTHRIEIVAYGNRYNTMAALHNADEHWLQHHPGAWRTSGAYFAYEYRTIKTGVLTSPEIRIEK